MSWNPLQDLMILQDRMNSLFEDATKRRAQDGDELQRADWSPAADVYETDSQFTILLDLPGIDREALNINVEDNRLMIRGKRMLEAPSGARIERQRGTFLRTFGVPSSVNQGGIRADYKDGVLEIHLPKQATPKGQRVQIKVTQGG